MYTHPVDIENQEKAIMARRYPEAYEAMYGEEAMEARRLASEADCKRLVNTIRTWTISVKNFVKKIRVFK